MAFFENLKIFVTDKTHKAAKFTGDVAQQAKLKYSIYDAQNELNKIFAQIGHLVYESYQTGAVVSEEVLLKCREVDCKSDEISDLEQKINLIKNSGTKNS